MDVKHGLLTLGEECMQRVFENGIPRRIFGPKRGQNRESRRIQKEELHSLFRSSNIGRVIKSRRLIRADNIARIEEGRSSFKILTGTATGNRPLGKPRRR